MSAFTDRIYREATRKAIREAFGKSLRAFLAGAAEQWQRKDAWHRSSVPWPSTDLGKMAIHPKGERT